MVVPLLEPCKVLGMDEVDIPEPFLPANHHLVMNVSQLLQHPLRILLSNCLPRKGHLEDNGLLPYFADKRQRVVHADCQRAVGARQRLVKDTLPHGLLTPSRLDDQ
jgi:hypothetical protein